MSDSVIYPEVFKVGRPLHESEKIFRELSGMELKEFLYQKYVQEGLTSPQIAPLFGSTPSTILKKLKDYGFARDNTAARLHQIINRTKSGNYDKTPTDVEKEYGRPFIEIVEELLEEGLSPSEISRKLGLRTQTHIRKLLKEREYKKQEVLFPEVFRNSRKIEDSERIFLQYSGRSLRDFLHEKYVIEGMSTHAIAPLFGATAATIHAKLKHYGISRNLSEARKVLIEKGEIEYTEILRKVRKTIRKSYGASNSQELARKILKESIEKKLIGDNITHLEVVVGYCEWSILMSKEVDLPVIIFNLDNGRVYKFAIEYSGQFYHQNAEKDDIKRTELINRGWKVITIAELTNMSNASIEQEVTTLAQRLIRYAMEGE